MELSIQERLKDLRVERGLTLEQLEEQVNLSKSALGSYEAKDFKLSLIHISLCIRDSHASCTRFCIVSRSSWANTIQIFSIARPIGVEVSNFSVEDTNSTSYFWKKSIIFAKSRMERLMRSSL